MTGRGKRKATGAPAKQRPSKRGRETNPSISEETLTEQMLESYPPQNSRATARITADFGAPLPQGWTDADENIVTEWWDESETKQALGRLDKAKHAALLVLWKTCFRAFQTSPLWIPCLPDGMQYQPERLRQDDPNASGLYSKRFCGLLTKLMVHPYWSGSIQKLRNALRFTVACRMDSHKAIRAVAQMGKCPAIELLNKMIAGDSGSEAKRSLHKWHILARKRAIESGSEPSDWSQFLFYIGETIKNETTQSPLLIDEFMISHSTRTLPLTGWDLYVVTKTIDGMSGISTPWCSVEDAFEAWRKHSNSRHEMPHFEQLPELYESFSKEVFRKVIDMKKRRRAANGSPQQPPPPPHQDEDEVEDESMIQSDDPQSSGNEGEDQSYYPQSCDQEDDWEGLSESSEQDQADRIEPSGYKGSPILGGDDSFAPDFAEIGDSADADVQSHSHCELHQLDGLEDMDIGIMSQAEVSLQRSIQPADELLLPRSSPHLLRRVPTTRELSPRGDYRIIVCLERENRDLRDALNKSQEEVQKLKKESREESRKYEEKLQTLQQRREQEIESFQRTVNNQTRLIESLDQSSRDRRNDLDPTATQSDPVLIYLGRQVRRQDDAFEEFQHNLTRVESRFDSRMNLLEREVMTQQLGSGRLRDSNAEPRELGSNLGSPGSGRATSQ